MSKNNILFIYQKSLSSCYLHSTLLKSDDNIIDIETTNSELDKCLIKYKPLLQSNIVTKIYIYGFLLSANSFKFAYQFNNTNIKVNAVFKGIKDIKGIRKSKDIDSFCFLLNESKNITLISFKDFYSPYIYLYNNYGYKITKDLLSSGADLTNEIEVQKEKAIIKFQSATKEGIIQKNNNTILCITEDNTLINSLLCTKFSKVIFQGTLVQVSVNNENYTHLCEFLSKNTFKNIVIKVLYKEDIVLHFYETIKIEKRLEVVKKLTHFISSI